MMNMISNMFKVEVITGPKNNRHTATHYYATKLEAINAYESFIRMHNRLKCFNGKDLGFKYPKMKTIHYKCTDFKNGGFKTITQVIEPACVMTDAR